MEPLDPDGNRVVDIETGDIYIWDESKEMYVLDETEVVTEYVPVEVNSDDGEPSDLQNTVSDLEVQVMALEEEVETLSDEVALMSAYDATSDYNLGTTNQAIFSGLVSKVPFGQHYVYWRDSQYSYKFAYGDISLEGTEFVGSGEVTICSYDSTSTNYNSYYTWAVTTDSNFSLSAGNRLVYSDLGTYPGMGEKEVQKYVAITAYVAFGAVLFVLFDRLRSACFRRL